MANSRQKANRRRRRMAKAILTLFILLILCAVGAALFYIYYDKLGATSETMSYETYFDMTTDDEAAIILDGRLLEKEDINSPYAFMSDGKLYLKLSFVKSNFDNRYYYDYTENLLRYTTTSVINEAHLDENGYKSGDMEVSMDYAPVKNLHGEICLESNFVTTFSPINITVFANPNRAIIYHNGFTQTNLTVKRKTVLRRFGGPKSPILAEVPKGTTVMLLEDYEDWCFVLSENGELGCIQTKKTTPAEPSVVYATAPEMAVEHHLLNKDISLAWHQVTNQTANGMITDTLASLSNVNVMCPTWYYISSAGDLIADISSADYVNTCHSQGYQVWALFSNVEDRDADYAAALNSTSLRTEMINTLVPSVVASGADGINLDFEEIPVDAGEGYIEFIRELSIECKKAGLILSVDNYVPTDYTAFYNRAEQAKYADYIIIMGYDEHNFGSTEAGSNASIGFVRDGVVNTLGDVPAEQVILGMPMYGRAFYMDGDSLKCIAVSMDAMEDVMNLHPDDVKWLDDLGQYYVAYEKDGTQRELWVENADSLKLKFGVLQEFNLAGAAYWKLTLENSSVWPVVGEFLNVDALTSISE